MKLAEVLIERKDLKTRLSDLESRIRRNAQYQEGDQPSEDPKELLAEYDAISSQLERMIVRINLTNNTTRLLDGTLMVEALARRDNLRSKHKLYTNLAEDAFPAQNRYSKKEIRLISSVDIKSIQKQADKIAKQYRELDLHVQQTNWTTDLS